MTFLGTPNSANETVFWDGTKYVSGSTVSFTSPTSSYTSTTGWFNVYEVDWTTLPISNIGTDGPININGVVWERINNVNALYMSLSGANKGLEIKVNSNASRYDNAVRTAPALVLQLKNIPSISSSYYDYNLYDLRLITQCSASNHDSNYEAAGIGLELSTSNTASLTYVGVAHLFHSTYGTRAIAAFKGFNGTAVDGPGYNLATENIFAITMTDPFEVNVGLSSSLTPSASFDPVNITQRHLAKFWWTGYVFNTGVTASSTYKDYNLLLDVNTFNANKDLIGNFYRTYVQIRPKFINSTYNPYFVSTNYSLLNSDNFIFVSASNSALTMSLPTNPFNGQTHVIKDAVGNAATYNIVVSSSNKQIDGSSTRSIATNYGSVEIAYTSSSVRESWSVV